MMTIAFTTGNDAFNGNYTAEVKAILLQIVRDIYENGPVHEKRSLFDSNGNRVGYWMEDGK